MQTNETVYPSTPAAIVEAAPVSSWAEKISRLKIEAGQLWLNGGENRRRLGCVLSQLRDECRHGVWQAVRAELGIPRSTAYDYIHEYEVSVGKAKEKKKSEVRKNDIEDWYDVARRLENLYEAASKLRKTSDVDIDDLVSALNSLTGLVDELKAKQQADED